MATSHGQTIQQGSQEPNTLEQQPGVQSEFDQAREPDYTVLELEVAQEQDQGDAGHGSEMVKEDAPTHDLRPPPEMAAEQDRETFNEKLEAEQSSAEQRAEERYEAWLEYQESQQGQENEQELDYDLSR